MILKKCLKNLRNPITDKRKWLRGVHARGSPQPTWRQMRNNQFKSTAAKLHTMYWYTSALPWSGVANGLSQATENGWPNTTFKFIHLDFLAHLLSSFFSCSMPWNVRRKNCEYRSTKATSTISVSPEMGLDSGSQTASFLFFYLFTVSFFLKTMSAPPTLEKAGYPRLLWFCRSELNQIQLFHKAKKPGVSLRLQVFVSRLISHTPEWEIRFVTAPLITDAHRANLIPLHPTRNQCRSETVS